MRIVTHPGKAHRDEFLVICLLLSTEDVEKVERREPTQYELDDKDVFVIDIGGHYKTSFNNFDHHQFPRDSEATCALSLVMKHMGIYEDALATFKWIRPTEVLDSKGPFELAKQLGCSRETLFGLLSPIEGQLLHEFSECSLISDDPYESENSWLYRAMNSIGSGILSVLRDTQKAHAELDEHGRLYVVGDVYSNTEVLVLDTTNCSDIQCGVESWIEKHGHNVDIIVYNDDRGDGYALYRRNDSPKVDFSKADGHDDIGFAHKGGFIAKTKTKDCSVSQIIHHCLVKE